MQVMAEDVQAGYVRVPGCAAITGLAVKASASSTKSPDRSGRDDYFGRLEGARRRWLRVTRVAAVSWMRMKIAAVWGRGRIGWLVTIQRK